ncbi:MAG: gliding motility-associated protein GldE [Bacteroidia bacterium]|nr:gliding motility-associated protein GldE [Bacteroidia bacterium]
MDPDPGNNILETIILLDQLILWPDLIGQYLLFFLLISLSFMVSATEVAFFSLTKSEIEEYKQNTSRDSQRIWEMISLPKRLLATILISNNFANVSAILVGSTIIQAYANAYDWSAYNLTFFVGNSEVVLKLEFLLNLFLITSIILFFGEIIPKVYAAKNRHKIVHLVAIPLEFVRALLKPISYVLIEGTRFIDDKFKVKETNASLEDLRHAINLTTTDDASKEEKEILKGIVNFSNITVKSVMRARVDVTAIDINMSFADLMAFINENNFSRLPVYEENLDNIKGILHIKDLLPYLKADSPELDIRTLLRGVQFIPESKKIDSLLEEFKSQRIHIAVVVDEFGGTAGIVTLEDVIEEIFGEINDEFDSEDWVYTKMSEEVYIFEGRISLIDVKKIAGLDDEIFEDARGDSDSLGGLILELHGKIPSAGEVISYRNYELHVESVSRNRISMVKFVIKTENEQIKSA